MVDSKAKGARWERDAVAILNEQYEHTWKKVPGSGALGTILSIDELKADLVGRYYFLPFTFRAEAKTGYGGAKQLAVKREWLEKVRRQAEEAFLHEVPILIAKFSGSRSDVRYFTILDFDAFHDVLKAAEILYNENIELREKLENG
jgi:hypothetical protein